MSKTLHSRLSKILASAILSATTGVSLVPNAGTRVCAKYDGSMVLNTPLSAYSDSLENPNYTDTNKQSVLPYILGGAGITAITAVLLACAYEVAANGSKDTEKLA